MQTVLDETKLRNPKNGPELSTLGFRRKRKREEFDKFLPLFFNLTSFICFKKKGLFSQWKKNQQSSFAKWIPSSIWQNNFDAVSEKPLSEMSAFLTSTFRLFHQLSVTPWCLCHYTSTHLHLAQAFPVLQSPSARPHEQGISRHHGQSLAIAYLLMQCSSRLMLLQAIPETYVLTQESSYMPSRSTLAPAGQQLFRGVPWI